MKNKIDPDSIPEWLKIFWNNRDYSNIIAGIDDDDCAILKISKDLNLIITTDFLNANPISVELGISSSFDLGRLLVASNISDLCGTGAKPIAFMTGITMKHSDTKEYLYNLFKGIKYELKKLSIPLIGGDTKLGKSNALLGIAIGISDSNRQLFLKNSAKPNDIIWVSGELGSVSSAVYGLSKNNMGKVWNKQAEKYINEPYLPILKSDFVAISNYGNGGTDISDGLGADLSNMLKSSNVGGEIFVEKIPYTKFTKDISSKINIEPWLFSLIIGGDFQFIVTTDKKYKKEMTLNGFFEIGRVTNSKEKWLYLENSKKIKFPDLGHRDSRNLTFTEEVEALLDILRGKIYENK